MASTTWGEGGTATAAMRSNKLRWGEGVRQDESGGAG